MISSCIFHAKSFVEVLQDLSVPAFTNRHFAHVSPVISWLSLLPSALHNSQAPNKTSGCHVSMVMGSDPNRATLDAQTFHTAEQSFNICVKGKVDGKFRKAPAALSEFKLFWFQFKFISRALQCSPFLSDSINNTSCTL